MNQNRQVIILGVLIVVVIGVFVYQFVLSGSSAPASTGTSTPSPAARANMAVTEPARLKEVSVDSDTLLSEIEVVTFSYADLRIERNPMTPLVGRLNTGEIDLPISKPTTMEVLQKKVTGIIWDQYDPQAVVDNEVVTIGHVYPNGVKVYDIQRDRVIFQVVDSRIPVQMKEL
jgi:hypothetical protein